MELEEAKKQVEASKGSGPQGVSRDDFEVLSLLGRGGFGEVKLVKCTINGQLYAMKAMDKAAICERRHFGDSNAQSRVKAERDVGVMANQWKCPFIIEMFAAFQTCETVYFVFEYCPQGDLFERLQEQPNRCFDEPTTRFYVAEIVLALEHLHAHSIIHRDVKLENVLLASDGHVKLSDFGIAKMNSPPGGRRASYGGFADGTSEAFYPPEFHRGEAYGTDLDCWQVGVATFLMLSGCLPEPDRPAELEGVSASAADFHRKLMATDRARRLGYPSGASQLRHHGFFGGMNWPALEAKSMTPPVRSPARLETEPAWPVRPTENFTEQTSGRFRLSRFTFVGNGLSRQRRLVMSI